MYAKKKKIIQLDFEEKKQNDSEKKMKLKVCLDGRGKERE